MIEYLPENVIYCIYDYLFGNSRKHLAYTCSRLKNINQYSLNISVKDKTELPVLFSYLDTYIKTIIDLDISECSDSIYDYELTYICNFGRNVRSLNITGQTWIIDVSVFRHIETLYLIGCTGIKDISILIAGKDQDLETTNLYLKDCTGITDIIVNEPVTTNIEKRLIF